jgi:hypothetical protein
MTKVLEKTHDKLPKVPALPESWYKVRGLLSKSKAKALLRHVKKLRSEWDQ